MATTGRSPAASAALAAALAAAAVACADVPASPTYLEDVRPILLANCVRCHGTPAPCTPAERRGYRLDHWSDVGLVRGVAAMTERITVRAADRGDMPPDRALAEREREILRRWQRAGSPRGEPASDVPPSLELRGPVPATEPDDQRVHLDVDVRDPDGDALTWTVGWRRDGVDGELTGPLAPGHGSFAVDVGTLASGSYQLVARLRGELEDRPIEVPLGAPIALGERNAAPTVGLLYPRGGERLPRTAMVDVRWHADDVDSPGPLTARLHLLAADGSVTEVAADVDARAGHTLWRPASVPAGVYDLELTITDGAAARSARTGCGLTLLP